MSPDFKDLIAAFNAESAERLKGAKQHIRHFRVRFFD